MNWQDILVYIVISISILYVIIRSYRRYKRIKKEGNMCDQCSEQCVLREMKSKIQ